MNHIERFFFGTITLDAFCQSELPPATAFTSADATAATEAPTLTLVAAWENRCISDSKHCKETARQANTLCQAQPSALILLINSSNTASAWSLANWQVPAFSCPPPPYCNINSPIFVLEVRLTMDLPVANTVF